MDGAASSCATSPTRSSAGSAPSTTAKRLSTSPRSAARGRRSTRRGSTSSPARRRRRPTPTTSPSCASPSPRRTSTPSTSATRPPRAASRSSACGTSSAPPTRRRCGRRSRTGRTGCSRRGLPLQLVHAVRRPLLPPQVVTSPDADVDREPGGRLHRGHVLDDGGDRTPLDRAAHAARPAGSTSSTTSAPTAPSRAAAEHRSAAS